MTTTRVPIHETWLSVADVIAKRSTCRRREVGCVLIDHHGQVCATGYNGVPVRMRHCTEEPCGGAGAPSGSALEQCEAVHAETNALLQCRSPQIIYAAYLTCSPCLHCVKTLLNTSCEVIYFRERYEAHHEAAMALWLRRGRKWVQWQQEDQEVTTC